MKRRFLMVLLGVGAVAGYASAFSSTRRCDSERWSTRWRNTAPAPSAVVVPPPAPAPSVIVVPTAPPPAAVAPPAANPTITLQIVTAPGQTVVPAPAPVGAPQ